MEGRETGGWQHRAPAEEAPDAAAVTTAIDEGRVRGVRLWQSAPGDAVFEAGAQQAGWRCVPIDTEGVLTKADYIGACAAQIPLPDYLGRNWDALEEALGDMGVDASGAGASGLMVIWRNWTEFAAAEPSSFQVALAIWRSVAADWRERLEGTGVILALDSKDLPAGLPESVVDEVTGISRVHEH